MFFKIMGVVCDADCGAETQCEGREATLSQATRQAREEGWSISSAGHFCPAHRQRRAAPRRLPNGATSVANPERTRAFINEVHDRAIAYALRRDC